MHPTIVAPGDNSTVDGAKRLRSPRTGHGDRVPAANRVPNGDRRIDAGDTANNRASPELQRPVGGAVIAPLSGRGSGIGGNAGRFGRKHAVLSDRLGRPDAETSIMSPEFSPPDQLASGAIDVGYVRLSPGRRFASLDDLYRLQDADRIGRPLCRAVADRLRLEIGILVVVEHSQRLPELDVRRRVIAEDAVSSIEFESRDLALDRRLSEQLRAGPTVPIGFRSRRRRSGSQQNTACDCTQQTREANHAGRNPH